MAAENGDGTAGGAHRTAHGVVHARPRRELLPEAADHQQGVVDAQSEAQGGGEVGGGVGDVGDAAEDEESGERADDGDGGDGQRQQGSDHAAEEEQEQHEGQRNGDGLGQDQVVDHLRAQIAAHGGATPGLDVERVLVRAGVSGDELLGVVPPLRLVAGDMGGHHGLAAVAGAQVGAVRLPVRDDVGEGLLLLEVGHQGVAVPRGRRVFDAAFGGPDQQDQVRLSAEPLVDDLRGPAGLRPANRQFGQAFTRARSPCGIQGEKVMKWA